MTKGMAAVLGVVFSFFVAGTASAQTFNLSLSKDRDTLLELARTRGVEIPKAALPEFEVPVIFTFDVDTNIVSLDTTAIREKGLDVEKVIGSILKVLPSARFEVGNLPVASLPVKTEVSGAAEPENPENAKETACTGSKDARPECNGELQMRQLMKKGTMGEPAAGAAVKPGNPEKPAAPKAPGFHPNENATKNFPKELANGMVLEKTAREGGHGFQMTITRPEREGASSHETRSTPSVEDERAQRQAVQAAGLHVRHHGMVEGGNPLSLTLGGKALKGRQ